jgi:hypothetical protein
MRITITMAATTLMVPETPTNRSPAEMALERAPCENDGWYGLFHEDPESRHVLSRCLE